jgi:prepilin-type N-terminal cleavage/methylation domain-containing protein
MQKVSPYKLTKQQGFTLLESLIALVIFSIVMFGSGLVISRMINIQKEMNIGDLITSELQSRLQNSTAITGANEICNSPKLVENIYLEGITYYVRCATEEIKTSANAVTKWPVLAVSQDQAQAQACATGIQHASCYVVGK